MITLYNVISSDGYIARKDGSEDFIPDELWPITLDLFGRYDALVMGRKTYESMQKYPNAMLEPLKKLPLKKVVVTRDRKDFHPDPKSGYIVAHSPHDALAAGINVVVSSGPTINTFFLENKLVDKIIHHQVPIEIETGIMPFDGSVRSALVLLSEKMLAEGVKELTYRVLR